MKDIVPLNSFSVYLSSVYIFLVDLFLFKECAVLLPTSYIAGFLND